MTKITHTLSRRPRIEDIELLRAIGIFYVLSEHALGNLIAWPSPTLAHVYSHIRGASGVDLFFAISGFVISRDLLPKLMASRSPHEFFYTTLAFWVRRIWRIFPSAWLWLVLILFATLFFNHSGAFKSLEAALRGTYGALLQIANLSFVLCFGHVETQYECGANFYYWSLSLEEQFYMLLPLTAFLLRKWLPWALIVLVVVQMVYPRDLLGSMIRTDALLIGALIAIWSHTSSYRRLEPRFLRNSPMARAGITLTLCLALGMAAALHTKMLAPYRLGIIAIPAGLLVLLASYNRNYLAMPSFLRPFMLWVGSRSCTIYLIHIPAFFITRELWFRLSPPGTDFNSTHTLPFILTAALVMLVLCETNFRFVEAPFRKKGSVISARLLQRHSLGSAAAAP